MKNLNILFNKNGTVKARMSILPFLVIVLSAQKGKNIDENNIEIYLKNDPLIVGKYIADNVTTFVDSYNSDTDVKWGASSIEKYFEINVFESNNEYLGMFLDFDANNGYAVVGNDYSFVGFETNCESPLKDIIADSFNYYVSNSYFTYIINGIEYDLEGYSQQYLEENREEIFGIEQNLPKQHYAGQASGLTGSGGIDDPDKYMYSRYGAGWYVNDSISFYDMNKYSMDSLSVYSTHDDMYFEGNCWAVTAYNCLQCIEKLQWIYNNKWTNIPAGDKEYRKNVKYYPSVDEPWQYKKYFEKDSSVKINSAIDDDEWRSRLPELWIKMRSILNNKHKYIEDGGAVWETSGLVEEAARAYGEDINGIEHYLWGSYVGGEGIRQLKNHMPLAWSTSNDTYPSHTMTVCGFKEYKRRIEHRYWLFGWRYWYSEEYILLYEICDGWTEYDDETQTSPSRYYDMDAHIGFSCIIDFSLR